MATSSQKSRVAVGLINLSGYTKSYNVSKPKDMLDVTVLTDTAKTFIPSLSGGTFSIDMVLDNSTASNGQQDVLTDWGASDTPYPITLAPFGFTSGSLAVLINGRQSELSIQSSNTEAVMASVSGDATGNVDYGLMVEDFDAITVDTNGTARDINGAGTANGGVAHLHVSAFSGLTSDAITIEHSANGTTGWSTLVTFATVTAVTSERVEVAAGTTVNRYLRVVDNVTGTGSVTRSVAFSRR